MKNLRFYFVDVFAEEKYVGNQLAVVTNAAKLSNGKMQAIANEMHFSETAFIVSDKKRNGGYDVRIFTPSNEVPFAGHPTLGTAFVIRHFIARGSASKVVLNSKVGQIPVTFEKAGDQEILWMKQKPPSFGKIFEMRELAETLQLEEKDFDCRYPIQEVSTGLPFIIVPLKTLNAVKRAKVNTSAFLSTAKQVQGGILIFSPQTYHKDNDLNVRVFVDLLGIPEDPATGSGNGCLAGYLSRYRFFGTEKVDIRVEQGYEVRRPSLILVKAETEGEILHVEVGGKVFLIAKGELT